MREIRVKLLGVLSYLLWAFSVAVASFLGHWGKQLSEGTYRQMNGVTDFHFFHLASRCMPRNSGRSAGHPRPESYAVQTKSAQELRSNNQTDQGGVKSQTDGKDCRFVLINVRTLSGLTRRDEAELSGRLAAGAVSIGAFERSRWRLRRTR